MVSASIFALTAAFVSALVARADVVPSEPSPGSVYREGQTCPIVWEADPDSQTVWKNMNIQLMTGDNFNMVHLTTVATGQDGTVSGRFEFPCPDVTVNAPIYFYQFTSPLSSNKTWTTRFTIASASGETTPAPNPTQPGSGDAVPWGVGALANPSAAVPPPPSAGGAGGPASGSVSASGPLLSITSSSIPISSSIPLTTSSSTAASIVATTSRIVVTTSASGSPAAVSQSANPSGTGSNGASGMSATSAMISLIIPVLAFMFL